MTTDFLCENRLKQLDPHLHEIFKNTAFVSYFLLEKYSKYFPAYTDHAVTHSLQVINFCNELIGEDNIGRMNADEIYVLLMACYLHDCGMGISEENYKELHDKIVDPAYAAAHPGDTVEETIRNFHHLFSADLVYKYADFFEIPTPLHAEAIAKVSQGHRRTDLYDPKQYPSEFKLPNGNTVCLPYLAALIRLADELDIAADRNISFVYPDEGNMEFKRHRAIKRMRIEPDRFVLEVDNRDRQVYEAVLEADWKLEETLLLCKDVIETRTKFELHQKQVDVEIAREFR